MGEVKKSFPIKGMHCASCVRVTERALKKTPGVKDAVVNLATEKATVTYNKDDCTPQELADSIAKTGYVLELEEKSDEIAQAEKTVELQLLRNKVFTSLILGGLIFWGTFPGIMETSPRFLHNFWIQLILATPVQFWAGSEFYKTAIAALKHRTSNMDTLVALGTTVAFLYSAFVTFFPQVFIGLGVDIMPYFDVSTIVIGLILLGRYFEAKAKSGTSQAIKKLIGLQAKTARVVKNGKDRDILIEEVKVGDIIRVRPGEKVPLDGEIIEGESSLDESMISGESIPVDKAKGDIVIGSTLNKTGSFLYRATKVGSDTMLSQIIKLVQEAQGSKAPIQRLADSVSSYFVPIVMMLALATFGTWYVFGPSPAFLFAMLNTVAVLIIACPCAMGLATPTAIMVGTGMGAEKGILIKDAESLETANKLQVVVFDKTGTLTNGKAEVTDVRSIKGKKGEIEVLQKAASIEKGSEHSLADAIINKALKDDLKLNSVTNFRAIPGQGIEGIIESNLFFLGNKRLMDKKGILIPNEFLDDIKKLETEGKTVMMLAYQQSAGKVKTSELLGIIAVADTVKDSAKEGIKALKKQGIEVAMITGDNIRTAQAIAKMLGIDKVLAEILPDGKEVEIRKIQADGKKVAMVGDGINDAPALAAADVGIAMGSGTDIAIEAADITLISKDLRAVASAVYLSKKTMRTIKLNLFWAFGYNTILIPVAAGVLYPFFHILLNPIFASVAMASSSISVVLSSLLLKRYKI